MLPATYLLPIRLSGPPAPELTRYLQRVSQMCPVVVVDNSEPDLFDAAHDAWNVFAIHIGPDPRFDCANGKVRNVLSGLAVVQTEYVVIADDDVRYGEQDLARLVGALSADIDLVIPQNYFEPNPWWTVWDTARILLNRVSGGDYPGTLGVRTELIREGYDGDVLFENLELIRTVAARGGQVRRCDDLYVRRLPPTFGHFRCQRVRNAYDEFARPLRLVTWLLVLPGLITIGRRRAGALPAVAALLMGAAETGRRRLGGAAHFPASASLLAPAWAVERAVCVWLAVGARLRGGVRYNGTRIVRATSPAHTGWRVGHRLES